MKLWGEDPPWCPQRILPSPGTGEPTWLVPSSPARGRPAALGPGQLNHEGSPGAPSSLWSSRESCQSMEEEDSDCPQESAR